MFKVESNGNAYVPSKSIALKPDVVSDVVGVDQIKINVPSYVGYIDPNASYLKFNLTMENARGMLVPDKNCGGHALIRNLEIRDGGNKSQIEYCEDYNANYALLANYTKQNTLAHKRELFSGVVSKLADRPYDPNLYYQSPVTAGGTIVAPTGLGKTATTPTIQMPLNCGLWKQGQVIPVVAMNGMRITIDTEDPLRALQYLKGEERFMGHNLGITNNRIRPDQTGGGNIKATGDDARGANANLSDTIFSIDLAMTDRFTCPFDVDDILYISNVGGGLTNEEKLGTIVGFSNNGAGFVRVSYVPDRNQGAGLAQDHPRGTSQVYVKFTDRQSAHQVCGVGDVGADTKTHVISAPTYRMSNIELIVQQITPPNQYAQATAQAVSGEKGVQMDIMAYELFRHNQNNVTGLQQMLIPTRMTRAKSIFSQPLMVSRFRSTEKSSLQGIPDNASTYEFIYGTKHYPSRLGQLARYSLVVNNRDRHRPEALHASELQKAILNVDEKVLSLQNIDAHFAIARGLTKYGQVMNLTGQTLSLRVDYADDASQVKLFNNYVYGLRRIIINKDGVQAIN